MRSLFLFLLFIAVLSATAVATVAQTSWIQKAWTVEDGLPQNSVNDLLLDPAGFLWIATYDGLARFDGTRFTVFRTADTPALPSNRVTTLALAPDQTIWIGTEGGVARLKDEHFLPFTADDGLPNPFVNSIAVGPVGDVWISTSGPNQEQLIRWSDGEVNIITLPDGSSPAGETIWVDAKGTAWSTARNGVTNLQDRQFQVLSRDADNAVLRVLEMGNGVLVAPTSGGALFSLGPDNAFVPWKRLELPGSAQRFAVAADGRGIWVGSRGRIHHVSDVRPERSITLQDRETAMIVSLLPLADGTLWVGTNGQGLVRLEPAPIDVVGAAEGLVPEVALSVTQDRQGTVWAGTNCGGVYRLVSHRAVPVRSPLLPADACVYAVLGLQNGDVLAGHRELVRIRGGRLESFGLASGLPENTALRSDFIIALYEDPLEQDIVWVGTQNGFRAFRHDVLEEPAFNGTLLHPSVRSFLRDQSGRLWIATRGGINILDGANMRSMTLQDGLPSNDVRVFLEDEDGTMWIGTYGGGLVHWDGERLRTITEADGLFENVVSSMILSDGMLWTTGNRGLARVAMDSLRAFVAGQSENVSAIGYQTEAGLVLSETNGGFQPAAWKGTDGILHFPTLAGVASLLPERVLRERRPPDVRILGIQADDSLRLLRTDQVLGRGQRNFEIGYAGIDLAAPNRLRYRFLLEGFDPEWVDAGTRREAVYTNVPPGRYTFRVQAANREGIWGPEQVSSAIIVPAYLYERTDVRAALLVMLVLMATLIIRHRSREGARREALLNDIVATRTSELQDALTQISEQTDQLRRLDHAKTRFFAETSHEFRTPLTLIIGPLERLLESQKRLNLPEEAGLDVTTALGNAHRLLTLINQLLKLAKFDAGAMQIEPEWVDLVPFIRARMGMFRSIAETRDITLVLEHGPAELHYPVDLGALETVLVNVVSNALQATPDHGKVSIHLDRLEDGAVDLSISDTGAGFDSSMLPDPFARYTTTRDDTRGTGLGLAIVREYVSLHGGQIEAENNPGGGAIVRMILPPVAMPAAPETRWIAQTENDEDPEATQSIVLVVDDHAEIRDFVARSLDGFHVLKASSGEMGLRLASEHVPDAIISDVMMPGMDGIAFCRAIREDRRTSHIPIVLLTARADSDSRVNGFSAGADSYIEKPFQPRELVAQLQTLLDIRQLVRKHFTSNPLTPAPSGIRPADEEFVRQIRSIISDNIENSQFGVDFLAEALSMGRRQLSRKLSALLNTVPSVMIRTARMNRARELLEAGNCSVHEVAARVGYNSASHFSQAFSSHFGHSPTHDSSSKLLQNDPSVTN